MSFVKTTHFDSFCGQSLAIKQAISELLMMSHVKLPRVSTIAVWLPLDVGWAPVLVLKQVYQKGTDITYRETATCCSVHQIRNTIHLQVYIALVEGL